MAYQPTIDPDDRPRFYYHAAPQAIEAALMQAKESHLRASEEILWLESLRDLRAAQIRNGAWPQGGEG